MNRQFLFRSGSLLLVGAGLLLLFLYALSGGERPLTANGGATTLPGIAAVTPQPSPAETATAASTATPTPLPPPQSTATPLPTSTASPTPAFTQTPTSSPTVPPTAVPAALRCPAEPRGVPEYSRYTLGGETWPGPDPAGYTPHFWLAKPLAGGGRLLTNQWFPYGYDAGRYLLHTGTDVAEDLGTPVLAAADGTIVVAGPDANVLYGWRCDWYGNLVVLELDRQWLGQPVYVLYGHVLNINVEVGQRVFTGEPLAEIGFGGAALLPHLHLEVRVGENRFGSTRNPLLWFAPGPTRGVIAGRLINSSGRPWQGVGLTAVNQEDGELTNTWSYLGDPDSLPNPDEQLAENFLFSDLRPGEYRIVTKIGDAEFSTTATVRPGELTAIEIVADP